MGRRGVCDVSPGEERFGGFELGVGAGCSVFHCRPQGGSTNPVSLAVTHGQHETLKSCGLRSGLMVRPYPLGGLQPFAGPTCQLT